ncbi:MAG: flavin-containing monooxygenase, partial [Phenylobacterium sp.]
LLDKNDDVGGTWLEADYPGCRVDNPNHNYSYSFAQRHDWPGHYSAQSVLLEYFRTCADAFDVRRHVRFGCTVSSAAWDGEAARWTVRYTDAAGTGHELTASVLISAVGQLNRPKYPTDVEGFGSFAGDAFHSAAWRHDVPLEGRRVVCIGTGASALQFLPHVAERAASLVVLQRTAPWLAPTADYHLPVARGLTWLYSHLPGYSEFTRFFIFWRMGDGALEAVRVDPAWQGDGASVSAVSEFTRQVLTGYLRDQFADRPDLVEKVVPTYPVGGKRSLLDNGVWMAALQRDNVSLVTDPISEITEAGIVTADGAARDFDVIIYGTGFHASKFLEPMKIRGRGGADLHQTWDGDPRAYLGMTTPGFPNLFMIYGPNTNIVVNGSIIFFSECSVRYIVGCLKLLAETDARAMEPRREVHDAFNARVDAANALMAWGAPQVSSWYKNEKGRVTQNWPFALVDYWRATLAPDPGDFVIEKAPEPVA